MKYQIIFKHTDLTEGKISLERLAMLSGVLLEVARGALQIRLEGFSKSRGKRPQQVLNAVSIDLIGLEKGSTILEIISSNFSKNIQDFQPEAFQPEITKMLQSENAMELIIKSYQDAIAATENAFLDKPLLQDMRKLEKVLYTDREKILIRNGSHASEIALESKGFRKIEALEEQTPESQKVILMGRLDLMEHSKSRVKILTNNGMVTGFLPEKLKENISEFWGKDLTLTGTANYKPSGKLSNLHIEKISNPSAKDDFFRKIPLVETVEQQINRQKKAGKRRNPLTELSGQWPGDESFEELLKMLTK